MKKMSDSVRCTLLLAGFFFSAALYAKPGDIVAVSTDRLAGAWLIPDTSNTVSIRLVMLAGEHDDAGAEGLAHYTEHLVAHHIRLADNQRAARHSNAWTTNRSTVYWVEGEPGEVDALVDRLSHVLSPLSVSNTYAEKERAVVQREFGVRVAGEWHTTLRHRAFAELNDGSVFARRPIGSQASIASFDLDQASAFHNRHYKPENAVLLVLGNVSKRAVKRAIERHFHVRDVPDMSFGNHAPPPRPQPPVVSDWIESDAGSEQVWWYNTAELREVVDPRELTATLAVLNDVLTSRLAGGLARPLRYDDFVLARFSLEVFSYSDRYIGLNVQLFPDRGVSSAQALERTRAVLRDIQSAGIPKSTLDKIKTRRLERLDDIDAAGWAFSRAEFLLQMRAPPESLSAFRTQLKRVGTDDLQRILDAVHSPTRELVYTISTTEGT